MTILVVIIGKIQLLIFFVVIIYVKWIQEEREWEWETKDQKKEKKLIVNESSKLNWVHIGMDGCEWKHEPGGRCSFVKYIWINENGRKKNWFLITLHCETMANGHQITHNNHHNHHHHHHNNYFIKKLKHECHYIIIWFRYGLVVMVVTMTRNQILIMMIHVCLHVDITNQFVYFSMFSSSGFWMLYYGDKMFYSI